jgi:transposase-like protein
MTRSSPDEVPHACKAIGRGCGTPNGWRIGGRCWECRSAHNADERRRRALAPEQRQAVLDSLRGGASPEHAAQSVGVTELSLSRFAERDGELRAALDGRPFDHQVLARQMDYLTELTRQQGNRLEACRALGLHPSQPGNWSRQRAEFRAAERAVLALWQASTTRTRQHRPRPGRRSLTEAEIQTVCELLNGGGFLADAARAVGVKSSNLDQAAADHPELARALDAYRKGPLYRRRGRPARRARPDSPETALQSEVSPT